MGRFSLVFFSIDIDVVLLLSQNISQEHYNLEAEIPWRDSFCFLQHRAIKFERGYFERNSITCCSDFHLHLKEVFWKLRKKCHNTGNEACWCHRVLSFKLELSKCLCADKIKGMTILATPLIRNSMTNYSRYLDLTSEIEDENRKLVDCTLAQKCYTLFCFW